MGTNVHSRQTRQRNAIREAFLHEKRTLSAEAVLELTQRSLASISLATVYRNIHCFLEEHWLQRIDIPGRAAPLYEIAGKKHHHHFQCGTCGAVFDLDGCCLKSEPQLPPGFTYSGHEYFIYGICPECLSEGPQQKAIMDIRRPAPRPLLP
ncbi:Fur family transcriptional regulator [Silvibacterium sp.]|uniref:Fur family transcriptional regulator n=1 Tax=Silvibacterium sp. TaxID=1964179 RepID=UPI0039E6057B